MGIFSVITFWSVAVSGLLTVPAVAQEPTTTVSAAPNPYVWKKLTTEPYPGKQDDIFFVHPNLGWYGNGAGKIFKTEDGGTTWTKVLEQKGTYFRCLAFLDELHGFAGNIGTDYFPNVADETPLYETKDGGKTWKPVTTITGPTVKGLCAMEIVKTPFINAGNLDYKTTIFAAGRVGGPAFLLRSDDKGANWQSVDMREQCGMILDIKFLTPEVGILCAATSKDVQKSHALILLTKDGGKTWEKKYESTRPYELTWKCSFPTEKTGYVTIQSYNPDKSVTKRYVAKTTDGGETWAELELTDDFACREFGIAFADENTGWVGAVPTGYQTTDGGKTWTKADFGTAANKIRLLKTPTGLVGYAIGLNVYKLDTRRE
jgi:photosystem II stability/assembly factor-like uncharacterized protein